MASNVMTAEGVSSTASTTAVGSELWSLGIGTTTASLEHLLRENVSTILDLQLNEAQCAELDGRYADQGISLAVEPLSVRHTAGPEHQSQQPLAHEPDILFGQGCPSAWDSFTCWPPTEAGRALRKPCAHIIASLDISLAESDASLAKGLYAYRVCGDDGNWLWGNWTNYTECLGLINQQSGQQSSSAVSLAVVYILLLFSLLSLIFLSASMFIFCYFRSLECPRTRVHRNLMLALAVHAVMLVVLSTPLALHPDAPTPFAQTPVLCKCVLSLKMYAATASINWMFVEGLLLHSRVAVSVFRQDAPFRLYYALGWGLPLAFILAWAYMTEKELRTACWEGYGSSSNVWILIAPRLVAILVNSVFLVNIVRILVTRIKPKASALETTQFRKAIKATALLFPLLGITHLLFCINPQNETMGLKEAYMIINAVLQSSQGIFVSVLYCFMDSESDSGSNETRRSRSASPSALSSPRMCSPTLSLMEVSEEEEPDGAVLCNITWSAAEMEAAYALLALSSWQQQQPGAVPMEAATSRPEPSWADDEGAPHSVDVYKEQEAAAMAAATPQPETGTGDSPPVFWA
ncbi:corticotropin-releasing factor receptor 2 [Rhipicephalus sanguineus]|uniref:corticotropin-releasing factor receptor 2 n=1 Tax=Rhipicephalus sanguineus TaxID=34632 RepID=UPI00189638CB|nr:corticotropin-releasing factor receptor 2 [Rhipicephalus sanguineus]